MCKKYDEFVSTREMVENIKDIASIHKKGNKIFDRDVADLLRVSSANLASMIKRDTPPIIEILLFCNRCGRDVKEIVFKKNC